MKKLMNLSRHTGGVLAPVLALVMAIVLLVLPLAPAHSASVSDLEVSSGEAKVLPPAPSRIAIGNGKIISASHLAGKQSLSSSVFPSGSR